MTYTVYFETCIIEMALLLRIFQIRQKYPAPAEF